MPQNTANIHLAAEGHDYGPSKRAAVYRFIAAHFGLDLTRALDAAGGIDESHITIEHHGPLHVFNEEFPRPSNAPQDIAVIERTFRQLQR